MSLRRPLRLVRLLGAVASIAAASSFARPAAAIRPFVTDDARVVGGKLVQLETWFYVDRDGFAHNALAAFGPTKWLELTTGVVHGNRHRDGYGLSGPILQAKGLLLAAKENDHPGFAVAGGVLPAVGFGSFRPSAATGFAYLAATENLWKEAMLIHANVGFVASHHRGITLGIGTQVKVYEGLHAVGEFVFGDPYNAEARSPAIQLGGRYLFSDHVQMDATFGTTLTAPAGVAGVAPWGTLGLRLVSGELW